MNIYLVYDKESGRILHSVSKYVLGNPEPIPMKPEEVLAELPEEERANVGVAGLPDDFHPRDRSQRITIEPTSGVANITAAPSRQSRTEQAKKGDRSERIRG